MGSKVSSLTGPQGIQGVAGKNGLDGKPGAVGPAGQNGLDGKPGDIGPKGEKGDKGDKGDRGDKGDKGDAGIPGAQGIQGIQGIKGEKGETGGIGPRGEKGDKGDKGDIGLTGIQGIRGERGETGGIGPRGEKGDKGDTGLTGATGARGEKGETGGIGPRGERGEKGDTGTIGSNTGIVIGDKLKFLPSGGDWLWLRDATGKEPRDLDARNISASNTISAGQKISTNQGAFNDIDTNSLGAKLITTDGLIVNNSNIKVNQNNHVEFGTGVVGKEVNAGKMGYGMFTGGAVDIVGGGKDAANRKVVVWDTLEAKNTIYAPNVNSNSLYSNNLSVRDKASVNDIYFTKNWQGLTDKGNNISEISNDTTGAKQLMIVGNK